ncbi:MAG TPA: hypothetical protein VM141_03440 [Planctomycetota bacterium]|nr:hypothetical protein [Planctomycetota bacterium]
MLRGGGWYYSEIGCRVSDRSYAYPTLWSIYCGGFRCARTLE